MYKCSLCEREYTQSTTLKKHIRECHPETLKFGCELCGVRYESIGGLQRHLTSTHGYDSDKRLEYYDKHFKSDDEGTCKYCGERVNLIQGRFSNGYMKFCYNKDCNVRWYNENTDRLQKQSEGIKKAIENNPAYLNSKIEYWLAKGYNEEEAKKKLSERQTTFSKKICIEKYGEEKGLEVWKERQKTWLGNYNKSNYSQISQEVFWTLYDIIKNKYNNIHFATLVDGVRDDTVNKEYRVETFKTHRLLDFYIEDVYKCIEFDGTYWHGVVGRGNRTRDDDRDKEIIESHPNIQIYHISESDYNKDKDKVIRECLEFLEG